jgi:diaminopimelate decarboxylase
VIGDAGVLVSRVVDVKRRSGTVFVGCDTGLSNFARPYVYGQFHRTTVIYRGRTRGKRSRLVICGNTVAARDLLSEPMPSLPAPREGDLVVFFDVGAYGFSMSSHFCARLQPAEVLVDGKAIRLIRKREETKSLWHGQEA